MDKATPVIVAVETPAYKCVVIEASDGYRYTADLSFFSGVYCYPKDMGEWQRVFIDKDGLSLVWSTRFEVHVDQVLANVVKRQPVSFFCEDTPA
ncbi:MAG: hypothetical protein HQM16_03735 [Deltaproteobacteria bacterium]|nr:hypothetical protein [Deltaproteobacteria bacterium]